MQVKQAFLRLARNTQASAEAPELEEPHSFAGDCAAPLASCRLPLSDWFSAIDRTCKRGRHMLHECVPADALPPPRILQVLPHATLHVTLENPSMFALLVDLDPSN